MCIASSKFDRASGRSVASGELAAFQGGFDQYCTDIISPDPGGTNCDACLSDGNARYIKCVVTLTDDTYVPSKSPSYRVIEERRCTTAPSTAIVYTDNGCTKATKTKEACLRQHTWVQNPASNAWGVNCN